MIQVHCGLTAISPLAHVQPATGRIKRVAHVFVADFTVRSAQLQQVDDAFLAQAVHEFLFRNGPSKGAGVEESKAMGLAEFLRTVVSAIILDEIAARIVIGGTERPVFAIGRHHASAGILLSGEESHGRNVVVSELTGPVQLQLVIEIAHGCVVIYGASFGGPVHTLLPIKLVVAFKFLSQSHLSGLRIDIFRRRSVVKVVDSATAFHKDIIPGNRSAGIQSLGNEIQFLFQCEVGVDARRRNLAHTADGEVLCRV